MAATDLDFSVTLRRHLMPENLDAMERLIVQINSSLGGDPRFTILFHAVSDFGGPNAGAVSALTGEEYARRLPQVISACELRATSELAVQTPWSSAPTAAWRSAPSRCATNATTSDACGTTAPSSWNARGCTSG
jgi:hypothetical protein